jgi:hypothetical protein
MSFGPRNEVTIKMIRADAVEDLSVRFPAPTDLTLMTHERFSKSAVEEFRHRVEMLTRLGLPVEAQ